MKVPDLKIEEWSNLRKHGFKNTSNNQDAATVYLDEILATKQPHQDTIIQLIAT